MLREDSERLANVQAHVEKLQALLEKRSPQGATQRIYRARGIFGDAQDYTVFTLVQYLPGFQSPNGTPDVKIRLYVSRSYAYTSSTQQTALVGQYAIDEIVAFLALDFISPDDLTWTDETKYLITDSDSIRSMVLHG